MNPASESRRHAALYVGETPLGEGGALLRFFAQEEGALTLRAPGLAKQQSKLAPQLKPADELSITTIAGRGPLLLTGVETLREHRRWREDLNLHALYWFYVECAYVGSTGETDNEQVYRLIVNLLRSEPAGDARFGALAVFCLKLLTLHGLLPDLRHCALSGAALTDGETAHLLPGGHGLVGLAEYNARYARGGGALIRLDAARRMRWLRLLRGPLLEYNAAGADEVDAAILLHLCVQALADIAAREIGAARFLREQWKLDEGLGIRD